MKKKMQVNIEIEFSVQEIDRDFIINHLKDFINSKELIASMNNPKDKEFYDRQIRLQHAVINNKTLLDKYITHSVLCELESLDLRTIENFIGTEEEFDDVLLSNPDRVLSDEDYKFFKEANENMLLFENTDIFRQSIINEITDIKIKEIS